VLRMPASRRGHSNQENTMGHDLLASGALIISTNIQKHKLLPKQHMDSVIRRIHKEIQSCGIYQEIMLN
jgi:hypothetical protein